MAINPREPKVVAPDRVVSPEALKPGFNWSRQIPAPGHSGVDFEERVNFRRLHDYRLNRARQALAKSKLGSILCFDNNNIRYLTSTVIGEWSRDKMCRFAGGRPIQTRGRQDPGDPQGAGRRRPADRPGHRRVADGLRASRSGPGG